MGPGPLAGVRVLDLTDDSGRFATKLLAECGASVVSLGRGTPGPAMAAGPAAARGGLLDWWYDGGKKRLELDLSSDSGGAAYRRLAGAADLIVETAAPGFLAERGIDYADLEAANPALVQVSLTPFGRTGPRAGWQTTDLVSAALGGVMSLTGLPDLPLNPWGRQAFNVASFVAAISGLASLRAARASGRGEHVDVSVHEAVLTTIEQLFFQYWFDDLLPYPKIAPRQGSLHWIRAYRVVPAQRGWLMTTPTPNVMGLMRWMAEEGIPEAAELLALPPEEWAGAVGKAMGAMAKFAATRDATELFEEAQKRHIAFGEVQTVAQVAANPQHAFRGFFRPVDWEGPSVRIPGPLARFGRTPVPPPGPPAGPSDPGAAALDELLSDWGGTRPSAGAGGDDTTPAPAGMRKPLEGLRVLDLSHVLAGPMATRVLGDLGADIVKLQTTERATTVNDPAHPYFYVYNRSKRAAALNMKDERSTEVMRRLIGASDVLIENFSAGVLARWGLAYEQVKEWNPGIIYLTMSGCGHEGPWADLVTYAPTIHALAGITYLTNPPGRGDLGPGYSLNDHAAGLAAAFSTLAAVIERGPVGEGQPVDIAQMETGGYLIGPALVDFLSNDREAQPAGNRDPFGQIAPNDCYRTADGGWLAVSCRDDADWARLLSACGLPVRPGLASVAGRLERADEVDALLAAWAGGVTADAGQELLQGAGVPAGKIQDAGDLMSDPQLLARGMWLNFDHPSFGSRPHDRYPALWSRSDLEPYRMAAAYVGEHNFEVYGELLGWDETAVAEAMGDGLFA